VKTAVSTVGLDDLLETAASLVRGLAEAVEQLATALPRVGRTASVEQDGVVYVIPSDRGMIALNASASFLWQQFTAALDTDTIVSAYAERTGVARDDAAEDVSLFVDEILGPLEPGLARAH
jgi:uncharacterized protein YidB (DUF937 family)